MVKSGGIVRSTRRTSVAASTACMKSLSVAGDSNRGSRVAVPVLFAGCGHSSWPRSRIPPHNKEDDHEKFSLVATRRRPTCEHVLSPGLRDQ